MKSNKLIYSILISIIIVICVIILLNIIADKTNQSENEIVDVTNVESNSNVTKNEVDEDGIPYLYIEYNNSKIKGSKYDFSSLFNDFGNIRVTGEDFIRYWNIDENQEIITINCEDIYDMNFYSSNGSVFSIEGKVGLEYKDGDRYVARSKGSKHALIVDKEKGSNIIVGVSTGNPNVSKINIYKIHYEDIGDVYYAFRFNCVEKE